MAFIKKAVFSLSFLFVMLVFLSGTPGKCEYLSMILVLGFFVSLLSTVGAAEPAIGSSNTGSLIGYSVSTLIVYSSFDVSSSIKDYRDSRN